MFSMHKSIAQLFCCSVLLLISISVTAQTKAEKRVQKAMEKLGVPTPSPGAKVSPEYGRAEQLVGDALAQLAKGEVNLADSLIRESIGLYPTKAVFQYIKAVCRMPDISKANRLMDELYQKVKAFPDEKLLLLEPFPTVLENGKMVAKVKLYEKERALFNIGYEAYKVNKEFADVKRVKQNIQTLLGLNLVNTSGVAVGYDFEYNQLELFKIDFALLQKDYKSAIDLFMQSPATAFYPQEVKNSGLAHIYQKKGDHHKALEVAESISGDFKFASYKTKFISYASLGNTKDALDNYQRYKAEKSALITNDLFYYLALVDIKKGEYKNALNNLDSALTKKMGNFMEGMEVLYIDRWEVYKSIGDAYVGLQQYDRAKDNYNVALLTNPDYEPAITALAGLESIIASTTSGDKSGPVITVSEPSVKRGLKVSVSGNDIMVRGAASDPSGIKTVSINGQVIYSQPGGNFWGNINLADGLNKLLIKATDGAGNTSEQTFEVEKAIVSTEIIAVTEKEGKNYCLLIGAQNYADSSIPSLENPIQDAVRLKLILKNNYNFDEGNIFTLYNPAANDIKRQLLELTNVIQPEDNLVIFYAGHGIWVEKEKKGYWLLTDAKRNDPNTWLQNKDVLNLIAKLPSRHTLLITDACFSGGVFKTRSIGKDAPEPIKLMSEKISRVAITSGNDTEVPDESVFMKYLVKALSENKDKYLPAQKMFINQIMEAVMTEGKTEPRYGTLELAGHIGGDFIFTKK
jgi:tetratricopeptide (TPR) repeat protein